MKKILIVLFVSLCFITKINASSSTFYYDEKVDGMYITKVKKDNVKNGAPFLLHKSNGDIVYCIEPFLYLDNGVYEEYDGFNDLFKLSEEVIDKMNLIAHYGYLYNNHNDLKWYGVTQYLIWGLLNLDDLYFTDSYYGKRVDLYQDEIKEINDLVSNHYVLPSFNDINVESDKNFVFNDENNVLNNYEIITDNKNITKDGNKLILNSLKEGSYKVSFVKKENKKNYMLYHNEKGQDLLLPGKIKDVEKSIIITVKKGNLKVIKNTKKNYGLSLNALYGIYDVSDNLIDKIYLDNDGIGQINLDFGKYYLKELNPPSGYLIDMEKHYFEINFDNNNIVLNVYDDIISKKINLIKLFGNKESKIYSYESGAVFEVYDKNNNLVGTYTTLADGSISFELVYGKYRIHQIKGMEGYDVVSDFEIEVLDSEDLTLTLYDNMKPLDVPDTYKNDVNYPAAFFVLFTLFMFNFGVYVYKKNIDN